MTDAPRFGEGLPRDPAANGRFKGRGRRYDILLACPLDGGGLVHEGDGLRCLVDPAHRYPVEDGITRLYPPGHAPDFAARSAAYDAARAAEGWAVPDEAAFKSLPREGLPGFPEGYWEAYADATALLWRFLEMLRLRSGGLPVGPAGEAAVIGAGMGWLAYGLDVAGYATIALDVYAGDRYGLGAYPIARYFRVQADPVRPPLARAAFDLLVYQRGMDAEQQAALPGVVEALRPGGGLAVMDALGEHDLVALGEALEGAGLAVLDPPRRGGLRARLNTLGDRVAGREPERPPVLFAQKSGRGGRG